MNKQMMILLCTAALSGCGKEQPPNKEKVMSNEIQTAYVKSKFYPDKVLKFQAPACIKPENDDVESTAYFQFPRLAFSDGREMKDDQVCKGLDDVVTHVKIYSFNFEDYQEYPDDKTYLLNFELSIGAQFIGENERYVLYRTGPNSHSVFNKKNKSNNYRDISLTFSHYDPDLSPYGRDYVIDIETVIYDKFKLKYKVRAIAKNPDQFAEKLRKVIDKNQSILDYPDILDEFAQNNEKVALYFENHSMLVNRLK